MKLQFKLAGSIAACILVLILGIGIGSVFVPPQDIIKIIFSKITQKEISCIESTFVAIVWNVRLPRVLVAFLVRRLPCRKRGRNAKHLKESLGFFLYNGCFIRRRFGSSSGNFNRIHSSFNTRFYSSSCRNSCRSYYSLRLG